MQKILLFISLLYFCDGTIPTIPKELNYELNNQDAQSFFIDHLNLITSDLSVCEGGSATLNVLINGGNEPFTYAWSGPNNFSSTLATPSIPNITSSDFGIYNITVTDSTGEMATNTLEISSSNSCGKYLLVNGQKTIAKYTLDFDRDLPTINFLTDQLVNITGNVLLNDGNGTDAGFDYNIQLLITGGPDGSSVITFPNNSPSIASRFQRANTKIGLSGGRTALLFAIEGFNVEGDDDNAPKTFMRDPSTQMFFSLQLENSVDFKNLSYELGDMDYNFISSSSNSTCFLEGESNDYRCLYSYIDRVTFLSNTMDNDYSFDDASSINKVSPSQIYARFPDANNDERPDLANDGRIPAFSPNGNIKICNQAEGNEIKFIYDDPGFGIEGDADGFHDFDAKNQVMGFLSGMTFDLADECGATHYMLCNEAITLDADPTLTDVKWFDANDIEVGQGNTLILDSTFIVGSGSFYYVGTNTFGCEERLCCPLDVVRCCIQADIGNQDQSIELNGQPAPLFVNSTIEEGDSLLYQWQSNTKGCSETFLNIPGATNSSYTPDPLSATTYYRAIVTSMVGNTETCQVLTNCIKISVTTRLGGCISEDTNRDRIQNDGVTPLQNIPVLLYISPDTTNPIKQVLTDANGKFLFDSLNANTYYIQYAPPSQYKLPELVEFMGAQDVNFGDTTYIGNTLGFLSTNNGFTEKIFIPEAAEILNYDVLLTPCIPITVDIQDTSIVLGDTITAIVSGPGNYTWTPSTNIDCDTCSTVNLFPTETTTYQVNSGEECVCEGPIITVSVLNTIGGCVREDLNRDGLVNDGNTPMQNIVVSLFTENDTINPIETALTNADGKYLFDSLPAGKYFVSFIPEIDYNFAPGFTPIGDMMERNGYSDVICLESGESDLIYDALLEKCYSTELSITEAKVFVGEEVCVTVSGGSNYEWTPTIPGYENCDTCTVFKITADSSIVYTVRSKDETACTGDEAQLSITTAFIDLSDPCNCLGNKQFGEIITIYSFSAGETWTYFDGTGLHDRNDPSILVPFGTVMTYGGVNADGFHIYNMEGIHIDSIGYTTKFTNGTQQLQISNLCYETDLCNALPIGSLGGCVNEDFNRDGLANDNLPPVLDVPVYLYAETDTINPIDSTLTDIDGKYLFDNLVDGKYFVSFSAPENYLLSLSTLPIGNLTDRAGYSEVVCVGIGEDVRDVDALIEQCYTTELSMTEARVFSGQEVCVTVSGGNNYEWIPAIPGYENCDTCTVFKITADSSRVYTVSSKSEFACAEDKAQLDITTAFIDISDPCNCLGNKQFGELITINSFSAGETWTYFDGFGLYDRDDASTLIPFGTTATYAGIDVNGFHIYELRGIHIDSIGYTTKFTNGTQQLQISNLCYETDLCRGLPIASLGGCVNEDFNRDGLANDGLPPVLNVPVYLYAETDTINPIDFTLTDIDGKYLFDNLVDGKYFVSFSAPENYLLSLSTLPIGNLTDRAGYSEVVCVGIGENVRDVDALIEQCYTTELSMTEARVFSGQEVCVTVSGGSNYEWIPAIPGYENCDTCTVFKITADSSRVYTVSSKSEFACAEDKAQLDITTAFIDISDPCNCLGNKQFGELITINSFSAGETWTYFDGFGLYDRDDASTLIPFGTTATYAGIDANGFHIYELRGIHIDSIGYTTKFTNGTQQLQISNLCYETDLCNGLPIGSLGGCVREDLNRDALANDGSTPMDNILVNLYVQGDTITPIASTTTGLDGKYLFDDLPNGKYFVEFIEPTDFILPSTPLPVGNLTDRNGFTDVICLDIGEDKLDVDALLAKCYSVSLGHRNFEIYEGDSITVSVSQPGDYLWQPTIGIDCINCQTVTLNPDSTTTYTIQWNGQDTYSCTHESWVTVKVLPVPCSMSEINIDIQSTTYPNQVLVADASVASASTMSYQWQSSNIDCEEGFSDIAGATNSTYLINESNTARFFRVQITEHQNGKDVCVLVSPCISLGRIAGCFNEDINDGGFEPLINVTINLYEIGDTNTPFASTTTNEYGKYDFNNIPTGKYFVEFLDPFGYLFPIADLAVGNLAERNGLTDVICLEPNEDQLAVDAYVGQCENISITASATSIVNGQSISLLSPSGSVQWLANGSVICSGCSSLEATPTETTVYEFQRINSTYGCVESGSIKIDVLQPYVKVDDPCNCDGGFIFRETITIYSYSADDNWVLFENSGFFQMGFPLRDFPVGTPITYAGVNDEGLHIYTLKGQHKDGEGYQLSFNNDGQNLQATSSSRSSNDMSISNLCFLDDSCPEVETPDITVPDSDVDPEATPSFPGAPVTDCTKPNIYAIHGLSIDLMRTGMIQVWANDFAHNSLDECLNNGSLTSRIWHSSMSDKSPNQLNAIYELPENLIFTCEHIGVQEVNLYIIDENGDWNFVTTYIDVQDNLAACTAIEAGNTAMVSGVIKDWKGNNVQRVNISSMGQENLLMGQITTTNDGAYAFELPMNADYTIIPKKDNDPLNGVSTFDLVLMTKHILGVQPFNSPYQWIAADVNNSGTITAFDIVQLRKMILGIDQEFINNTSWRFLAADYIFESATILNESLEEISTITALHQDKNMDFLAIKIGDINGNARANNFQQSTSRNSKEEFIIEIEDQLLQAGKSYDITFTSKQIKDIQGYQFTLAYGDLSVTDVQAGLMQSEHFGLHRLAEGLLTASWNTTANEPANNNLFTLQITADQTARLSDVLQLQNNPTITEAYDKYGNELALAFSFTDKRTDESFELFQNEPNPFNGQTNIGFYLPGASEVELILRDDTGRVIKTLKENREAGINYIQITELENNKGLIYYQLITDYGIQSKKMLQLR